MQSFGVETGSAMYESAGGTRSRMPPDAHDPAAHTPRNIVRSGGRARAVQRRMLDQFPGDIRSWGRKERGDRKDELDRAIAEMFADDLAHGTGGRADWRLRAWTRRRMRRQPRHATPSETSFATPHTGQSRRRATRWDPPKSLLSDSTR